MRRHSSAFKFSTGRSRASIRRHFQLKICRVMAPPRESYHTKQLTRPPERAGKDTRLSARQPQLEVEVTGQKPEKART